MSVLTHYIVRFSGSFDNYNNFELGLSINSILRDLQEIHDVQIVVISVGDKVTLHLMPLWFVTDINATFIESLVKIKM